MEIEVLLFLGLHACKLIFVVQHQQKSLAHDDPLSVHHLAISVVREDLHLLL